MTPPAPASSPTPRRARWTTRARGEDGYTILLALVVLLITLALATVAVTQTLDSRSHATRDARSQRALQAADAGVNAELYRFNQVNLASFNSTGALGTLADCVIPQVDALGQVTAYSFQTEATLSTGACNLPSASGVPNPIGDTVQVGNHAFYETQGLGGATTTASPIGPNVVLHPKIVSVGVEDAGNSTTCSASAPTTVGASTSGCAVRRVMATLAPIDPFQVVEAAGNLTINGALTTVVGDMRTNGNLAIPGLSVCVILCLPAAATIIGTNPFGGALSAHLTYGGTFTPPAGVFVDTLETLTQAAHSVNRRAVTVNDQGCPAACVLPSLPAGVTAASLGGLDAGGAPAYSASTQAVSMASGTLTFTSGDYVLCDFHVTGGTVRTNVLAASSAPVRIFVDSPTSSRCSGNGLGATQGTFRTAVGVSNLVGGAVTLTGSSYLQVYVVGGSTTPTPVDIGGGLTESMFLYAPTSDVALIGLAFEGNLIGNNVTITAPVVTQNLGLNNYSLANGVGVFHLAQYSECSPVYPLPEPDPTVGC